MRIEILCTGDEVLTGKIVNSNFSYISQKLEDFGLQVVWGTTVGDDRDSLMAAFRLAADRADAVIVNGGLGPTVDDLSQEMAAKAAGVELVLSEEWLVRMEEYFQRRSRIMPPNNRKQAMLPATAEILDNPVGTACGFALDIAGARFFFTPGVPRELRRMLEEQIIPRLLKMSGVQAVIHLKRFHSYGIGESRADTMLAGLEELAADGSVKLGFRAHYPQLETKITVRGRDMDEVQRKLEPVTAFVRERLGNFIVAEDERTLEGEVLGALVAAGGTLAVAETFTGGQIAARFAPQPGAECVLRRAVASRDPEQLAAAAGVPTLPDDDAAVAVARGLAAASGASHGLAVLVTLDEGADRIDLGGTIRIAIVAGDRVETREARVLGGREWVRLGATEMGLDCLRRFLLGLPVAERIDFEKG